MHKKISIDHAEIKTAGVELKVIKIDRKQMTLAVFRQIPYYSIIGDSNYTLRGTPWGTVNYYWGDQPDDGIHVLWQHKNELRRCIIRRMRVIPAKQIAALIDSPIDSNIEKDADGLIKIYPSYTELKHLDGFSDFNKMAFNRFDHSVLFKKNRPILPGYPKLYESLADSYSVPYKDRAKREKNHEVQLAQVEKQRFRIICEWYSDATHSARETFRSVYAEISEEIHNHNDFFDEMADLDQIFIAI